LNYQVPSQSRFISSHQNEIKIRQESILINRYQIETSGNAYRTKEPNLAGFGPTCWTATSLSLYSVKVMS